MELLLLTTAFDPGDIHPDGPYTHVNVLRPLDEYPAGKSMRLEIELGKIVDSVFTASVEYKPMPVSVRDHPKVPNAHYSDYQAGVTSKPVGTSLKACWLQALIDVGAYAGTIVTV